MYVRTQHLLYMVRKIVLIPLIACTFGTQKTSSEKSIQISCYIIVSGWMPGCTARGFYFFGAVVGWRGGGPRG